MAGLSDYYPDRWSWSPYTRPVTLDVGYRSAASSDFKSLRLLFRQYSERRPSVATFKRWVETAGWNVWVATRNLYNVVGAVACRHVNGKNEVLAYAFDPFFVTRFAVLPSLLTFVQYEMPEYPLEIVVRDSDLTMQQRLRELGLTARKPTDDHEHWLFQHPPIVTLKPERSAPVRTEAGEQGEADGPTDV